MVVLVGGCPSAGIRVQDTYRLPQCHQHDDVDDDDA